MNPQCASPQVGGDPRGLANAPSLHPALETAFQALDRANVIWCLLRIPAEPAAPTGDVDLLIDPSDAKRVRQVLERLEFVRVPTLRPAAGLLFLTYHAPTERWIWLHIVSELGFGPGYALETRAAAGCLARRRRKGQLVLLARDDLFWTSLLHCLLDKGAIAVRHRAGLQDLAGEARTVGPLARAAAAACPSGWTPARIIECARTGAWAALEELGPALAATWRRRQPRAVRLFGPWMRGARLPANLLDRLRRRGLSVALLGPDGAGKSTLAERIKDSVFFPVRPLYMGHGVASGNARLPLVARWRVPYLGAPGRLLVLWRRFLTARYHTVRGRLVIFDRYPYDILLPVRQRLGRLKRLSHWIHARACPEPDLVLVLDAPGALLYERKGERDAEELEAERHAYRALHRRIARLQVVDASRSEDEVHADVVGRIWREYLKRWGAKGKEA